MNKEKNPLNGIKPLNIRKAKVGDVVRIKQLIDDHMNEGFMLPRPLSELYENTRDFFVVETNGEIHGCVGLHIVWGNLAEIKSLVVDATGRGQGWGKTLVDMCLQEAKEQSIPQVFALTKIPDFFIKMGFHVLEKEQLPHKVWAECIKCHKFPQCDETAVGITVCEENGQPVPKPEGDFFVQPILIPKPVSQTQT